MNHISRHLKVASRTRLILTKRWPSLDVLCSSAYCTSKTWAWYQLESQPKRQPIRPGMRLRERGVSILRDPGVVVVEKLRREDLVELLVKNVVYKKGALVAINKPQGLSITGRQDELTLLTLLPDLCQHLGFSEQLHVVKAAIKESSGLVLLSSCHFITKRIEEFFIQCRRRKKPVATYCAVTVGSPDPSEGDIFTGLKLQHIGGLQLVVPVNNPSRGSLERKEVKKTLTHYRVLNANQGCALVQFQPMTAFQNQIIVHATLKLCPVLGDHLYSARVGKVLGEPIFLPVETVQPRTQVLEDRMLQKMHFTQQQMHRMPLHLHLHELLIPVDSLKDTVTLTAPLPSYFLQTLSLLGLTVKEFPEREGRACAN
ncbi:mitochondrial mRNA pseudouridine synthase RPUSD3 [Rhinatrema bivittatum]|uniref:mitochondrial mRNA pseudouridine synthase RPUSD3 n=1 Tax=Rhinatrema bivittatum TaxID=194408 RepID=UPI00112D4ACC|nr:mitochondrial mRNA pseudouridine synthase RPUSD3 [Rhinatrema bivittatum]XP_029457021.1 mitochondrial mRNA pseudouridine synthase RPUSD3 [Rhinatrema bivittatum]XP_029457022.1 mitochondrial mRNA pseudouridine synthase RPUSD3 [Rhinatrema bivittatum]